MGKWDRQCSHVSQRRVILCGTVILLIRNIAINTTTTTSYIVSSVSIHMHCDLAAGYIFYAFKSEALSTCTMSCEASNHHMHVRHMHGSHSCCNSSADIRNDLEQRPLSFIRGWWYLRGPEAIWVVYRSLIDCRCTISGGPRQARHSLFCQ